MARRLVDASMRLARMAIPGLLAGAAACGGASTAPPSVGSTISPAPIPKVASQGGAGARVLTGETNAPWSDGSSDTAPNRFLETKGLRFAYRAFGRKPGVPVVFLAPVGRNMDFWDPSLTDAVAQGHLVVLFDNVGVGLSSGESPKTVAEAAKQAEAFIDGLRELHMTDPDWVNGRVDLLGFSFGGCVAQRLALDRPELVERLVLAGTAPQGGKDVGMRTPAELNDKRETAGPPSVVDDTLRLFFTQSETSKDAGRAFIARTDRRQKDRDAPVAAKTVAAQTAAVRAWGSAPDSADSYLASLEQPVLVADGVADIVFPTKNSIHLAQVLPHAQLVVYPDSAHGFLFQYPERFAEHVSTFLRRP
jgi:pimeloyl-ACP methyl ester carboxylesterase